MSYAGRSFQASNQSYLDTRENLILNTNQSDSDSGFERGRSVFRRRQISAGFLPAINSVDSDSYEPEALRSFSKRQLRKSLSEDSPIISPSTDHKPYALTQGYFNPNLKKQLISRAHSLISDDQVIDVQYDSDVGWQTTNVRRNPYNKKIEGPSRSSAPKTGRDRIYSRDDLKLDLKDKKFTRRTLPNPSKQSKHVQREESVGSLIAEVKSKLLITQKDSLTVKEQLEGKVVSPRMSIDAIKCKYVNEAAIGFDKNSKITSNENYKPQNAFVKCRSRSSATSNDVSVIKSDDDLADEVFDKNPTTNPQSEKKSAKTYQNRLSISLDDSSHKKRNKSFENRSRNNSVKIKNKPDYNSATNSRKLASSNAIAKPSRGSLKKSKKSSSSDYDRDRGRSRHMEGGHRESFKKNERTNDRHSDQDRDASDRELKDGSLNRSLSNTDTNLEDRIGEST